MNREYRSLNTEWKFYFNKMPDDAVYRKDYDDAWWESVNVPHTLRIEPYDVLFPVQGQCWYRKHLFIEEKLQGKKLFLEFEGAMQECDIWLNGEKLQSHYGGYLPFTVDITDKAIYGQENVIAVFLQNLDNPDIPPGKSSNKLDFQYWGGLYRNVRLCICDKLHITDAVYKNKRADGGVFFRCEELNENGAKLFVSVNVDNESDLDRTYTVQVTLRDKEGKTTVTDRQKAFLAANSNGTTRFMLHVSAPHLWSDKDPYLYQLEATVFDEQSQDTLVQPVGIRWLEIKAGGLYLNNEKVELTGANRHQQYPHLGIAVSDQAHYREVKLLKEGGFNFLRLCHYPQAPAVYRACDELGMLVLDCTPGWQWCKETGPFKTRVYQNIRDMIRRDRNHPCVVLWEVSLNETAATEAHMWNDRWSGADDDFMHYCHLIAHEEYPGSQMYTSGDSNGRVNLENVDFDVFYFGLTGGKIDGSAEAQNEINALQGKLQVRKPLLCREYGDFSYGFHFSTTRRDRGDGEHAMLHSAWNFAFTHNKLLRETDSIGDAIWVAVDYTRPYFVPFPIEKSGVLDIFRIPKFSYYFFASQRDDKPVLYIANYWQKGSDMKNIVVFSNCEEVALLVNGKEVGRQQPQWGGETGYNMPKKYQAAGYWNGNLRNMLDDSLEITKNYNHDVEAKCFDGSNTNCLNHPPLRFEQVPYEEGTLEAVGYIGGKEVVRQTRKSEPKAAKLSLVAADQGIPLEADGVDFVFVYACVQDETGALCVADERKVRFSIDGGELIGRNPVNAQAGIAPVIVRKNKGATQLKITADAQNIVTGVLTI